jgi:nucleotide-binding universal stress UspA family protein
MTEAHAAPVVVGVSPTSGSIAAVEWALDHARRIGAPLVAVTAWQVPVGAAPSVVPAEQSAMVERLAAEASTTLAKTVRALTGDASSVSQRVERGTASAVLVRASESAQLLVVGPPHPGELSKLRPSLLVPQVVYGAACPVVVLPQLTYDQPSRWRSFAGRLADAAGTAGRPGAGVRVPPAEPGV